MKTLEVKMPLVTDREGRVIGYGGSQEWFPEHWQQMAGCGATAGAGMAACLGTSVEGMGPLWPADIAAAGDGRTLLLREDYVDLMCEMYRRMPPRRMGYPYAGKWAAAFRGYAEDRGVRVQARVHERWRDWSQAFEIIRRSAEAGRPVAMLILFHRAKEMRDELWHWVLATGCILPEEGEEAAPGIIISDYADRDIYDAAMMLEAHPSNLIKLVEVTPD